MSKEKYSSFSDVPRRKGKSIDWKKLGRDMKWRRNLADMDKIAQKNQQQSF